MFDSLIEQIQKAVTPQIIEVDGEKYASTNIVRLPSDVKAKVLNVKTLEAIKNYLAFEIDKATNPKVFIHIVDESTVRLCGYLNKDRDREVLLEATFLNDDFRFGTQYDQATFITLLQSAFYADDNRRALQTLVGGLTDESSLKLTDDGVSQQTVAKAGITTVERTKIDNPFKLTPFRTFPEVGQPESEFILRLHRKEGSVPTISLHESDNRAWRLEAIENIGNWIKAAKIEIPVLA